MDSETFYNPNNFAILPMAFCYPGKAEMGDLPPLKICAPTWHNKVLNNFKQPALKILIGKYAQDYYLKDKRNLTERVKNLKDYLPEYLPLPHPSPVNRFWRAKNPWFEAEMLDFVKDWVREVLT